MIVFHSMEVLLNEAVLIFIDSKEEHQYRVSVLNFISQFTSSVHCVQESRNQLSWWNIKYFPLNSLPIAS